MDYDPHSHNRLIQISIDVSIYSNNTYINIYIYRGGSMCINTSSLHHYNSVVTWISCVSLVSWVPTSYEVKSNTFFTVLSV